LGIQQKGAAVMVKHVDRLEEEVFEFVRTSEEAAIETGRKLARVIEDVVPVEVPAVKKLVDGIFDFTGEVVKSQREFALKMLDEARQSVEGTKSTTAKPTRPARTSAAKPRERARSAKGHVGTAG